MSQKNDMLSCAYSMLATECSRLKAGQPSTKGSPQDWQTSSNMVLDPKILGGPKSPDRWWSSDL
jgi:hypothetical protein